MKESNENHNPEQNDRNIKVVSIYRQNVCDERI